MVSKAPIKLARRAKTASETELDDEYGIEAARIIKAAMARKGLNTPALAELLSENGRPTEPQALRNLLSRGKFKAAWLLHVLDLLGEKEIKL